MRNASKLSKALMIVSLCIIGLAFLYPFVWMISTSLKTSQEALIDPISLLSKSGIHLENYATVWNKLKFFTFFFNSALLSLGAIMGVVLLYSATGFAIAKLNFKGRELLFIFYLSIMFVPSLTLIIPLYILVTNLGLADTYLGLLLPIINGGGPFAVLLFTNFFKTIPKELLEAGIVDGAGYFRIYSHIFFPIALPVVATISIITFVSSWNGLLWPMIILTSKSKFTLPMGLMYLDSSSFRKWNELMAGSVIAIIPVIIGFVALQKYYIQGITSGTIKG